MYTEFFGLNEKPFSISPDPRYLYLSRRHADALAHLIYGISEAGGFIQLTGEVGTGKTTLIRSLLEQLPEKTEIALVLNPQLSTREFLKSICQELRAELPADETVKSLIDCLNAKLLEANAEDSRVVLIVDEAQTLSPELLEQVRLLTNLETAKRKLLQIILIGQPELRDLLARPEMRQIAQRITGRYHLEPLNAKDANIYVRHRLKVAGAQTEIFTDRAIRRLFRLSGGIPRLMNVIADRALLAAYTREQRQIGAALVSRAADEVFGRARSGHWLPWAAAAAGLAIVLVAATQLREATLEIAEQPAQQFAGLPERERPDMRPETSSPSPTAIALPAAPERSVPDEPRFDDLGALLADGDLPTDAETASAELFGLWQAEYDPAQGTWCQQAQAQALSCLTLSGTALGELRQLNRPAILLLTDSSGQSHEVTLSGLGYDHAELAVAGRMLRVSIAELTHYWYGEHRLLWKPMTDVSFDLTPGMRTERVAWLRESLATIRGTSVLSQDPTLYDAELVEWVRDYQRERRLGVDGVVGIRTQLALQADLERPGIPRLNLEH